MNYIAKRMRELGLSGDDGGRSDRRAPATEPDHLGAAERKEENRDIEGIIRAISDGPRWVFPSPLRFR